MIPSKRVIIYPNNKPWVTKQLKTAINNKKRTFYTGNLQEKKAASREVKSEIIKAKARYRRKIEKQYATGDLKAAWQGIKTMGSINQHADTNKRNIRVNGIQEGDMPDALNTFFARFENSDFAAEVSELRQTLKPQRDIVISEEHVIGLLKKTNT